MPAGSEGQAPFIRAVLNAADMFGRFMSAVVQATVAYGPEVLTGVAGMRAATEHFELLQKEWAKHPLLDFMMWQPASTGHVMAMTLPQEYMAGHAALARLLKPACTAAPVLDELHRIAGDPRLAGWAADEFRHGLEHVRLGEFDRAVTPLTVGLEGLIRLSALNRQLMTATEERDLRSGKALVKHLWAESGRYGPYMARWVFGLANDYRHGSGRRDAAEQALHAVCGGAIWALHLLEEPQAFELIEHLLSQKLNAQYARGELQVQPEAEARLQRAIDNAADAEDLQALLRARDQLLEIRARRQAA